MTRKILLDTEAMQIVLEAVTTPDRAPRAPAGAEGADGYLVFLDDLGGLIAKHFGGKFLGTAVPDAAHPGCTLSFAWDCRVPADGGAYARFDDCVSLDDWKAGRTQLLRSFWRH